MKIIIVLAVILLLVSCRDSHNDKIDLDLSKRLGKLKYSQIFDTIRYIHLDNRGDCMIGNVNQLLKDDSLIFIMDQKQKSIFIFNESGKFIQKINQVGKGDGEYISLTSFCIDAQKRKIFIYDEIQKKILQFNYNTKYERQLKLSNSEIIRSIGLLENGDFIFFTPDLISKARDGVWEVDNNGRFVKEYKDVNPNNRLVWIPFPYYSNCNGKISYYDCFTNEIFFIKNSEIQCEYRFNLKQMIPNKYLEKETGLDMGTGNYYLESDFAETQDHYYLQFYSTAQGHLESFFEKSTNKIVIGDSLVNDIDDNSVPLKIFTFNKSSFAGIVWGKNSNSNPTLQLLFPKKIW